MSSSGNVKYSKSFTWDGSKYILNDENSVTFSDIKDSTNRESLNNAHYTCWNTSGECTTLSYIYNSYNTYNLSYINLTNGKSIEDAINEMLYNDDVNKYDSTIKTVIDKWYENNLASYSNYLEDTIFCDDRRQINSDVNGWNPNGGSLSIQMNFKNYNVTNDLSCANEIDKFSTLNNKAKLKYKIGLISLPEKNLLNNYSLLAIPKTVYWFVSPTYFFTQYATVGYIGSIGFSSFFGVGNSYGVRPAVSLAPSTEFTDGDGSTANPYVVG
jgi:hypothetical protein